MIQNELINETQSPGFNKGEAFRFVLDRHWQLHLTLSFSKHYPRSNGGRFWTILRQTKEEKDWRRSVDTLEISDGGHVTLLFAH